MKPHGVHLGRRGRVLLFFGCLDLVYGASLAFPEVELTHSSLFMYLNSVLPIALFGVLWLVIGVICLWQAFMRRDSLGFAAAISLKVLWGLLCLGGWLFGHVERGYVSAAIWLGLSWFVWTISGWREPDEQGVSWTEPSV